MGNKILKNIFKNMDYNIYNKLNNITFISTLYSCVNPLINLFIDCPTLEIILSSYILLAETYYFTTTFSDCEQYTKEIKDIANLYNELIDNYVTFNNSFDLKHPLEIYSMYSYMLHNGYLSKDNNFEFGKSNTNDIKSILGVNVITGHAVCRHISSMLNDIYSKLDLNSSTCTAYLNQDEMLYMSLNIIIPSLEEQMKNSLNSNERKKLEELIIKTKNLRDKVKPKDKLLNIMPANHMINLVSKDNIGYIIDPTNEHIYKNSGTTGKDILKSYVTSTDESILRLRKTNGNYTKKREILSLPNSTDEEDNIIISKTTNLYNNNLDLLEKFKYENLDLYNEINDKLVKLKKK